MKNLFYIAIIGVLIGTNSCENAEWEFEDYDYTTVYFPYQYPVRTIVLGDYYYDNSNDQDLKFLISPRVGGMYENHSDWSVEFQIKESLTKGLVTDAGDTIKALPSEYYTLNPESGIIVIPKGRFHSGIEVQLTEAFLKDSFAAKVHYVIPLQIISTTADSILNGISLFPGADPRKQDNWNVMPKNFTLFGIKYANLYHGRYLVRGRTIIEFQDGSVFDTITYHAQYIEKNEINELRTSSINEVQVKGVLQSPLGGDFIMSLNFDNENNCIITSAKESSVPVTGMGKFVKDGDEWGGGKRNVIYLSYQVDDGVFIHSITDTLVFRDKGISFEEFTPVVVE